MRRYRIVPLRLDGTPPPFRKPRVFVAHSKSSALAQAARVWPWAPGWKVVR